MFGEYTFNIRLGVSAVLLLNVCVVLYECVFTSPVSMEYWVMMT